MKRHHHLGKVQSGLLPLEYYYSSQTVGIKLGDTSNGRRPNRLEIHDRETKSSQLSGALSKTLALCGIIPSGASCNSLHPGLEVDVHGLRLGRRVLPQRPPKCIHIAIDKSPKIVHILRRQARFQRLLYPPVEGDLALRKFVVRRHENLRSPREGLLDSFVRCRLLIAPVLERGRRTHHPLAK